MLNWAIMKHPVNWVTVFLMVAIGMIALHLLLTPWHTPTPSGLSANSEPGPILQPTQ